MKKLLVALGVGIATIAVADIIIKSDGTVVCTGQCHGTLNPTTGAGTVCQGSVCIPVGPGGIASGGTTTSPPGMQHK